VSTFLIHAANLRAGGGVAVAASLLEEWSASSEHRFVAMVSPEVEAAWETRGDVVKTVVVQDSPTRSWASWRAFIRIAQELERTQSPPAVLTVFGPALWRPRAPHLMGFANGLYLFSDSRFIREDWPRGRVGRAKYAVRRRLLLHRVRSEADAWWVETENAKAALVAALRVDSHRVHTIYNAPSGHLGAFFQESAAKDDSLLRVLVLGAAHPNKNLSLLPALRPFLADLPVRFQTTLPPMDFSRLFGDDQDATHPWIENLGVLQPADLPAAYAAADAVFLPSKLETFSAVWVEAMAAGRPLVTSGLPAAHAVCGDAVHYFDAWNPADAARALRDVLTDASLRGRLVVRGKSRLAAIPTAADRAASLLRLLEGLARGATSPL